MKNVAICIALMVCSSGKSNAQQDNKDIPLEKVVFEHGYFTDSQLSGQYQGKSDINFLKTGTLIFFNNGNVMYCNLGFKDTDSSNFVHITKRVVLKDFYGVSWGKYNIENDLIKVEFWFQFFTRGLRLKYYKTYFEGIIADTITITNWKMVSPYPKVSKKLNENFETLKTGKDLKFLPNQGTRLIEAKEAWIN